MILGMKRFLISIITICALAFSAFAQDQRQRTLDTIISDALASLPAENAGDLSREMLDLAKNAPESVVSIASMMKPAGKNAIYEYALSGLTGFATNPVNSAYKAAVKEGFEKASAACKDAQIKAFLDSQIRLFGDFTPAKKTESLSLEDAAKLIKKGTTEQKVHAAEILSSANPKAFASTLLKSLKGNDRKLRASMLEFIAEDPSIISDKTVGKIVKALPKASTEAKEDILNWIGEMKLASALPKVLACFDSPAKETAIKTAGILGGEKATDAIIAELGGDCDAAARKALASLKGDFSSKILQEMTANPSAEKLESLIKVAASKRMKNTSGKIYALAADGVAAAREALPKVVSTAETSKIGEALASAKDADFPYLAKALSASIHTLPAEQQLEKIKALMDKAANKANFFMPLAETNLPEAVKVLTDAYNNGPEKVKAADALMIANTKSAIKPLLKIARTEPSRAEAIAARYVDLTDRFTTDPSEKIAAYSEALSLTNDPQLRKKIIRQTESVPTMRSFLLASKYLDDNYLGIYAANAVSGIASKCKEINYNELKASLDKATQVLKKRGSADDLYAVDAINKTLAEATPEVPAVLDPEEAAEGFKLLFNGVDMTGWHGDLDGYRPVGGTIDVATVFGAEHNLYTEKEYKDFVFRFEFCFLRPGINNGVGIRTPTGVDAAYDGMCEVQILDHDAPIYANLREYQVHGSVYGVIPAKRIVHKPLGEWSTEEIRVEGTHIKVTVNGEVIVDGDISEACQGHNVAPDGGSVNPYTVDHRNHPGMFNEKGYIGFLGHGTGLRLRNIRVLDLTEQQAAQPAKKSRKRK